MIACVKISPFFQEIKAMTTFPVKWNRILLAGSFALSTVLAGCGGVVERTDFAKSVDGKSEDEVVKNVGKPDSVDTSNPEGVKWTYVSRTFDVSNKNHRDAKTIVVLKPSSSGKLQVSQVMYE
jgi:hypothetical protein